MIRLRSAGFTLLEILVALAVLALSMSAIIKVAGDYTGNQSWLRDRTMANWVARNVLLDMQLKRDWPAVGERKGSMDMGRQEWRWLADISQTDEAELRRVDVEVSLADSDSEEPYTVLSGFLRQP